MPVLGHNLIISPWSLFYTADDFSSVDVTDQKPWRYLFALATNKSAAKPAKTPAVAAKK
jgi:hypothetical protein